MRSRPTTAGRPRRWLPFARVAAIAVVLVGGFAGAPPRIVIALERPAQVTTRPPADVAVTPPAGGQTPAPPAAAPLPPGHIVPIDAFDTPAAWSVIKGSATLASLADPAATRTGLAVTGVVATERLELGPTKGPAEVEGLPRTLLLDVKGDSAWRPVYLQLRDATGEIFHFWIGRIASTEWTTMSVDLTAPPAATMWGDADGVLDLPVSFFRIVVDPLPDGSGAADFALDDLRLVVESMSTIAVAPKTFVPSVGATGTVSLTPGRSAPFVAVLRDESGRVRTWRGTGTAGTASRFTWNGRDDAGALMAGSIQGRLTLGTGAEQVTVDEPYLGGLLSQAAVDPSSIVGMNTFLSEPDPSRRAFVEWQARRLEEARVSQIRETFIWDRLEPRKGWFEWAKFDQAVEIAEAHGIGVLGVLAFSANWASSAPDSVTGQRRTLYGPTDLADFAAYVRAVVRRYGDRIDEWEVWNEPNHPKFWFPHPNPEDYAALLHVAAQVIRQEDPGAVIVLGGIVGTDVKYLDRLRAAGAWPDFDVLAIHGYVRLSPEASGLGGWFDRAVAYVDKHGRKPVWLTEICWPISPAEPGIPAVTASSQAAFLGRTFVRAAEAGVARVFWYNVIDHSSGVGSRYDQCGLFDANATARPTFAALRTVGAAFDGSVTMGMFDAAATARRPVDARAARWKTGSANRVTRLSSGLSAKYRLSAVGGSVLLQTRLRLPGKPTSIVATVSGDGSGNSLLVGFADGKGEHCSATFGALRAGTRTLRLPLDGSAANWNCSGGDGDHVLDAPVTLRYVKVSATGIGPLSGTFSLTGLAVGEGPVDRGLVLARGRSFGLLVSRSVAAAGATTTIALPGGAASELVNGARRSLTVTDGVLRLGVGPQVRMVEVPVVMTSGAIAPATWSWMRWIAGDGTKALAQVVRPDGSWVRTDVAKTYSPGPQSTAWDGRLTVGSGPVAATPGRYTVRVVVTAPDGRTGMLFAPIDVR